MLGFARRAQKGWTYSPATVEILQAYMNQFPEVFEALGEMDSEDRYVFSNMFPGKRFETF